MDLRGSFVRFDFVIAGYGKIKSYRCTTLSDRKVTASAQAALKVRPMEILGLTLGLK